MEEHKPQNYQEELSCKISELEKSAKDLSVNVDGTPLLFLAL